METEQICADGSRGALHSGGLSSAVQLRGSIPLVWGHGEQSRVVPRPDIHVQARSARDRPEIIGPRSPSNAHVRRAYVRARTSTPRLTDDLLET